MRLLDPRTVVPDGQDDPAVAWILAAGRDEHARLVVGVEPGDMLREQIVHPLDGAGVGQFQYEHAREASGPH